MRDGDDCGAVVGMNEWHTKPKYSDKTCPNAAVPSTDHTWIRQESNPGRRSRKSANDGPSYGWPVNTIDQTTIFLLLVVFFAQFINEPDSVKNLKVCVES
jgi:hypothetical protein